MVNSGSSANLVMLAALKKYFKWHDNNEIINSNLLF
jgi:CDP-6-deoxy-D-xylo-4-hexulose-3-dehydrase